VTDFTSILLLSNLLPHKNICILLECKQMTLPFLES